MKKKWIASQAAMAFAMAAMTVLLAAGCDNGMTGASAHAAAMQAASHVAVFFIYVSLFVAALSEPLDGISHTKRCGYVALPALFFFVPLSTSCLKCAISVFA